MHRDDTLLTLFAMAIRVERNTQLHSHSNSPQQKGRHLQDASLSGMNAGQIG